jgi:PAS domain S-box-containing protein
MTARTDKKPDDEALAPTRRRQDVFADALRLTHAEAAGAWDWDIKARRLLVDEQFALLNGLDSAEARSDLPTSAFFSSIHPEDKPRIRIAVAAILSGAEMFSKEYRLLKGDGTIRWVHARGRGLRDGEDRPVRFTGILADITEQKRIEERLRVAQEAGGVGTFEYVEGFGTATVSEQFCRLLGLHSSTTLPVATINSVVAPGEPPLIDFGNGPPSDRMSHVELRIKRADNGEIRWIARRGQSIRDAETAGLRFTGVIFDITLTKKAEENLRDLNETLESRVAERTRERDSVWSLSRDLFGVFASDGAIVAANPAWTDVLGYTSVELRRMGLGGLSSPDDLASLQSQFQALGTGLPVRDFDMRLRSGTGELIWVNWTFTPGDGVVYGVGRDVTQRKHLEDQLRQAQKMEAVGQLTGGIAHDFNNLLTGIVGALDLLQTRIAQGRTENIQRYTNAAMDSANRAAALTHRLLAFARRQPLDPKPVDANRLVGSMQELLRSTLSESIELDYARADDLWLTLCDPHQLESAILNLVINARDAMPNGGRVTIGTGNASLDSAQAGRHRDADPGLYVVISVSDTGSGMPADVIAQAFDPFFTTKPIGQGTGLGLSMVYGFAKQSEGHVRIDSTVGEGTTVKIYLPCFQGEAELEGAALAPLDSARSEAGETVLVVEDEPVVRALILEVLQELGYRTVEAADGPAGLKAIETKERIDLLVTDVGLPGLNGRQLAEYARSKRPELKVLFITGYAESATTMSGFLLPGMEMIAKPFSVDALASRIRRMIETP